MFVAVSIWGVFLIPWYTCLTSPVPARYSFIYAGQHKWHYVHGAGGPQVAYVSIHITLDWILLAIPVYLVLKLQMPIAKRLRAIIPISVGCLSAIGAAYNCHLKSLTFKDQNCKYRFSIFFSFFPKTSLTDEFHLSIRCPRPIHFLALSRPRVRRHCNIPTSRSIHCRQNHQIASVLGEVPQLSWHTPCLHEPHQQPFLVRKT